MNRMHANTERTRRNTMLAALLTAWLCLTAGYEAQAFYACEFGKWINRDPIGERGGINQYGFVGNMPTRNADFFGLAGSVVGGLTGPPDTSNCLGYAMTGDPSVFAQPAPGQSMKDFLASNGWNCSAMYDPKNCTCDCKQDKMLVYLQMPVRGVNSGKDPYRDPIVYGGEDDFHGLRGLTGCSEDYTQLPGAGPSNRKPDPKPVRPKPPTMGPMYCCCKDASK
jgi:hypothetical protein